MKKLQFVNDLLSKFVTKLVTKKASNLLAKLKVLKKVNKLLTNWDARAFWPIALGSAY